MERTTGPYYSSPFLHMWMVSGMVAGSWWPVAGASHPSVAATHSLAAPEQLGGQVTVHKKKRSPRQKPVPTVPKGYFRINIGTLAVYSFLEY